MSDTGNPFDPSTFVNAGGQSIDTVKDIMNANQKAADATRLAALHSNAYNRMYANPIAGPLASQLSALFNQYQSMADNTNQTPANRVVCQGLAQLLQPLLDQISILPGI